MLEAGTGTSKSHFVNLSPQCRIECQALLYSRDCWTVAVASISQLQAELAAHSCRQPTEASAGFCSCSAF
eukprot:359153-Chlamydomonas_euryale.AAC.7